MARGWESKSVEEQQSDKETVTGSRNAVQAAHVVAGRERQRQELELQRERILAERTSSPVRRAALIDALDEIERRLAVLAQA